EREKGLVGGSERENWSERAGPPPHVRPLVVVLNGNDGGGGGGGGKGGESKVGCWPPPPYITLVGQVLRGSPRKNITAFS
ncbi:hypothetical protein ALC53_10925, partial [Atta colombica]